MLMDRTQNSSQNPTLQETLVLNGDNLTIVTEMAPSFENRDVVLASLNLAADQLGAVCQQLRLRDGHLVRSLFPQRALSDLLYSPPMNGQNMRATLTRLCSASSME